MKWCCVNLWLALLLPATCLMADLPFAEPEAVGMSPTGAKRISQFVERWVKEKKISSAVTVVARRGKAVHFESHGFMDIASI